MSVTVSWSTSGMRSGGHLAVWPMGDDPLSHSWIPGHMNMTCADADFDPNTLYIPARFWSEFTPFEKQYWEVCYRGGVAKEGVRG
jgi:hypothetical protein